MAVLALLWECIYHFPLPRAGENPRLPLWDLKLCSMAQMMTVTQNECCDFTEMKFYFVYR